LREKIDITFLVITLLFQVDNITVTLLNLERKYKELERWHSDLQKDLMLDEVIKLQEQIRLERKEHECLAQSSNTRFDALQRKISLLLEEGRNREVQMRERSSRLSKLR
jgi:hypothetical protein